MYFDQNVEICGKKEDKESTNTDTNDEDVEDGLEDEANNWNDFDIETLNFDKFIKDHQQGSSEDEEKKKQTEKSAKQSNLSKRKLDSETDSELKAKRRVSNANFQRIRIIYSCG